MSVLSTNLNLTEWDLPTDDSVIVEDFIEILAGISASSNMEKIDAFAGEVSSQIDAIKGTGYTDQTIKANYDAITALNSRVTYTVPVTGTNTLVGTISQIVVPLNNSIIKLVPSVSNTGSVTLNINGEGAIPVVKIRTVSGSVVYSALEANDFRLSTHTFVTKSQDGLRYIALMLNEVFSRNVFYDNGDTTFTSVQDKITSLDNQINTPDYGTATLNQDATSLTVTDSYKGISKLSKFGGATLYNAPVNGDFSDGTTGWEFSGANGTVTNKILRITGTGTSATIRASQDLGLKYEGIKFNVGVRFRIGGTNLPDGLNFLLRDGTGGTLFLNASFTSLTLNTWIELPEVFRQATIGTGLLNNLNVIVQATYADASTANSQWIEIDGNVGVFAIPLTGTPYESYTAAQMNKVVNQYFEGLHSNQICSLLGRATNIFNGVLESGTIISTGEDVSDQTRVRSVGYTPVKPSTKYSVTSGVEYVFSYDSNKKIINSFLINVTTFTTQANAKYIRIRKISTDITQQIMINEGSTALPYVEYDGSTLAIECSSKESFAFSKLPNGVENQLIWT